jgi:hypothetical protein
MIRLRRGAVLEVLEQRPGAVEVSVEVEGSIARAIVYPALVGPVKSGDRVLLNTTAVSLGLGTGGVHFVVAVEGAGDLDTDSAGRIMKARYTPHQVAAHSVEETDGETIEGSGLDGMPVVWVPLHSMIGPAAAGACAAGASTVAYVMTDGAALPAPFSRLTSRLKGAGLVDSVISTGQAFGGDLEAVTVFTGLLAARHVVGADVAVVGDGPGNTGTGTTWGASDVESAMSLNAAAILGGRPVAALRVSFADQRERHRGLSHHSITALSRVATASVHVAVPVMEDEQHRETVWNVLRETRLDDRHQLVEVNGQPSLDLLAERGIEPESMGRTIAGDPEFFLAAGAAGVLAGRMAAGNRAWTKDRG